MSLLHGMCITSNYEADSFTYGIAYFIWDRMAQLVQRLTTGWLVQGSNSNGGEILCTHLDLSWGPLGLL